MRFDITVNNAAAVCMRKSTGNLAAEVQRFVPGKLALLLHILKKRDAVNQLHNDVFKRIAVADVIDSYDIRVRQHGNRMRLGTETAADAFILRCILPHDFDGYASVEA